MSDSPSDAPQRPAANPGAPLHPGLSRFLFVGLALVGVSGALIVALAPEARIGEWRALLSGGFAALALGCALVAQRAPLIVQVVRHHMRAADGREERFRTLRAIAADGYWESDERHRLVTRSGRSADGFDHEAARAPHVEIWALPQFDCDAADLARLRADLDKRMPFRNLAARWRRPDGQWLHLRISGEPRVDEHGAFRGYWGVVRDVSADVRAREALSAAEARYRELFSRIPAPLVMHRGGCIIDANPAAVALFGFDALPAMLGRELAACYESGPSRERARLRIAELGGMAPGASLPVDDFQLLAHADGRRLSVRVTGVRVDVADGPAILSVFIDDTGRRAAEEAVRRSEAMLSHLVATSPDIITLSDFATGRYVMVNRTFERLTGYLAAEVIGRSRFELGLWPDAASRDDFLARLREHGAVTDVGGVLVTKRGQPIPTRLSGACFAMDEREYLVINARDVTETERARREQEAILETAAIGIAVTRERRFALVNPYFEHMHGWPRGSLTGQPVLAVWDSVQAYDDVRERIAPRLAAGEQVEIDAEFPRRDGGRFVAHIIGKLIDPAQPSGGGALWIVQDVTERREFETTLARARDAAEAASRAKSAFLANTSHELRTPLHGLLGLADLARSPGIDEASRRQYLDQIGESAQSLTSIISDILDLSKIEAGKLQIETTRFDLGELLHAVCRAYGMLAHDSDLVLQLTLDPAVEGAVHGDPLRVRQIVGNYLSNAIKFTTHGQVRVDARRHGERVRFEVRDNGKGIPAEAQATLFRPFTQADESTTRRFGGTGLGLSICRELAHLMGGEVGVASQVHEGSCFWAELPLPVAAPAVAAAPPEVPMARLRGARVLVVEDNPVNMLIAVAMLERLGMVVGQAGDGLVAVEAVELAASTGEPYDAVLMDLQMPVMSGYEATRMLRERPAGRQLPIVALTAAALVSERDQALADGMDDFLTKPIDAEKLGQTLARWVKPATAHTH
jgi:PAS domain S-box-containing protein